MYWGISLTPSLPSFFFSGPTLETDYFIKWIRSRKKLTTWSSDFVIYVLTIFRNVISLVTVMIVTLLVRSPQGTPYVVNGFLSTWIYFQGLNWRLSFFFFYTFCILVQFTLWYFFVCYVLQSVRCPFDCCLKSSSSFCTPSFSFILPDWIQFPRVVSH